MIRIAIVEDQAEDFHILESYIQQYCEENKLLAEIKHFANGLNFLDEYTPDFDVVFMDVEMPHIDGIDTSRKLRELDQSVPLVFVTNMIQYAINGYEVDAIDFMVKPVTYYNFSKKLSKALVYAGRNHQKHMVFRNDEEEIIVPVQEIYYIEKDKNYAVFSTKKGEFRMRATISDIEGDLKKYDFIKCCSGCIVNLAYISKVKNDSLFVNEKQIPLARRQKKEFLLKLAQYLGGADL